MSTHKKIVGKPATTAHMSLDDFRSWLYECEREGVPGNATAHMDKLGRKGGIKQVSAESEDDSRSYQMPPRPVGPGTVQDVSPQDISGDKFLHADGRLHSYPEEFPGAVGSEDH